MIRFHNNFINYVLTKNNKNTDTIPWTFIAWFWAPEWPQNNSRCSWKLSLSTQLQPLPLTVRHCTTTLQHCCALDNDLHLFPRPVLRSSLYSCIKYCRIHLHNYKGLFFIAFTTYRHLSDYFRISKTFSYLRSLLADPILTIQDLTLASRMN
jgi:hypothetical protein